MQKFSLYVKIELIQKNGNVGYIQRQELMYIYTYFGKLYKKTQLFEKNMASIPVDLKFTSDLLSK